MSNMPAGYEQEDAHPYLVKYRDEDDGFKRPMTKDELDQLLDTIKARLEEGAAMFELQIQDGWS